MSVTVAMSIPGAYSVVRWEITERDTATELVNVFLAAAQGLGFAESSVINAMWEALEERDPERFESMFAK